MFGICRTSCAPCDARRFLCTKLFCSTVALLGYPYQQVSCALYILGASFRWLLLLNAIVMKLQPSPQLRYSWRFTSFDVLSTTWQNFGGASVSRARSEKALVLCFQTQRYICNWGKASRRFSIHWFDTEGRLKPAQCVPYAVYAVAERQRACTSI